MKRPSVVLGALLLACGAEPSNKETSATAGASSGNGGSGGSGGASAGGAGGTTSASTATGFDPGVGGGGGSTPECSHALLATIRDFQPPHPDFETYSGSAATTGLVQAVLGADQTPQYAPPGATSQTTGPNEFAQWYHDTPGVNVTLPVTLTLDEPMPGKFLYDNSAFFPIDGQGFGNYGASGHNFHFTTQILASFVYKGGELFTFRGDDDLWVFVNKKLALDLGGLHGPLEGTIDFDALAGQLELTVGKSYALDIFHAERHTEGSNFRIETTIDCFVPIPPPQ
jgi:fibro-slime domain-containing protein